MSTPAIEFSIVIPVYNEAENINHLAHEINAALQGLGYAWECVWVDDGSQDGTLEVLQQLVRGDPRHRYLALAKNCGQSAALWAGFMACRGRLIGTLDGDGQNDPADLPRLLEHLERNRLDLVNGYREKRQDTLVRKIASWIANGFRNAVTMKTVRDVGCSTRVLRRECLLYLPTFAGMHRFLPTLIVMRGFRSAELPVRHRPRLQGQTKYTINTRLWVGLLDTFGVLWLQKRAIHFEVRSESQTASPAGK